MQQPGPLARLSIAVALCASATAAAADPADPAALFADQEYEGAVAAADAILADPAAPADRRAVALEVRGSALAVLGRDDEATAAFVALLGLAPDRDLPASTSPRIRRVFRAARGRWEADREAELRMRHGDALRRTRLDVAAPARGQGGRPLTVTVTLTDPGHLARTVVLYHRRAGQPAFSTQPQPAGPRLSLAIPAAVTASAAPYRLELYVTAVHDHGLAIARHGGEDAPITVAMAAGQVPRVTPLYRRWWVWAGAAAIVIGGGYLAYRARDVGPQDVVGTR